MIQFKDFPLRVVLPLLVVACNRDEPLASRSTSSQQITMPTLGTSFYLYEGQPIYLEVDPTIIVVASRASDVAGAVREVIGRQGLKPSAVRALKQLADHWEIELPSGTRGGEVTAAVDGLRADNRFTFASTGFRVASGGPRVKLVDRIAVQFRPRTDRTQVDSLAAVFDLAIERTARPDSGKFTYWFRYPRRADPLAIAASLYRHPLVEWAHPDMIGEIALHHVPSDPYYAQQWNLKATITLNGVPVDDNVELAWDLSKGGGIPSQGGLTISIIDDGVQSSHPDFGGRVLAGHDEFGNDNNCSSPSGCATNPNGNYSHGTLVAGVVGAEQDNGQGVTGIAPGAWILPVRIFLGDGTAATDCQIADAIDFAWSLGGAAVLSNSWGYGPGYPGNDCVTNAIARASTQGRGGAGSVVVFSAGNTSDRRSGAIGPVIYPASLASVIAVGAIDRFGALTNYTPEGSALDIVAPSGHDTGECLGEVISTDLTGDRGCNDFPGDLDYSATFSGTSAAAPQVSAVAALLISREPALTADQVKSRIYSGADPWGAATQFGAGKVDAFFTLAPLADTIIGPARISSAGTYTWTANPSGGSGTYTYQWMTRNDWSSTLWTNLGTAQNQSKFVSSSTPQFFSMGVRATSLWRSVFVFVNVWNQQSRPH